MPKRNLDENVFVKCPYYKCESQCVIHCEGVEENNRIHMAFATKSQRKDYEKQFCQSCWGQCMIAEAHNRKWGYEVRLEEVNMDHEWVKDEDGKYICQFNDECHCDLPTCGCCGWNPEVAERRLEQQRKKMGCKET